ncbi:MAG TPA: trypsin-like peptidase domain-containing protein [Thermoanaerobaculia bacterium]|nr:trypsin-like peptidase domain-containing protein [Thermoanaerobaculia bacterium]
MSTILTIRHLSGSLSGKSQRIALQEGQVLRLGRAPENDIKFSDAADDAVSGMHAELSLQGGRLFIEDKRSSNGTFVNGAPCPPFQKVTVPDGSRIRLAKEGPEMQVTAEAAPAVAAPPPSLASTGAGATAVQPPKEAVGRATMLREIDRARQEERDVVVGELAKSKKSTGLFTSLGLAAVLLLAAGGIGGTIWWTKAEAKKDKTAYETKLAEQQAAMDKERNVWPAVERKVSPAVVYIKCSYRLRRPVVMNDDGSSALMVDDLGGRVSGSGVQIRPGLILTALHVVEPWKFAIKEWDELTRQINSLKPEYDLLEIQFPGQQPLKATLVAGSQKQDLALLQVQQTVAPAVPVGKSNADVKVTDEIAILGYPGGLGQYLVSVRNTSGAGSSIRNITEVIPTFIRGTVAQPLTATGDTSHNLFFDASIEPGNSGGPVVNRNGELIGIVSSRFQRQGEMEILGRKYPIWVPMAAGSVAVTPDDIMDFLRKSGIV